MKYIDADQICAKIKQLKEKYPSWQLKLAMDDLYEFIDSLQQDETDMGEVSDGYHTFNELYYYRMLYNAAFFNLLPKEWVHKSKRHHTGEECFGGGWFIVMANLPTGQISNHYELKDWDLFKVPEKEFADEWDGHTPQEAAERLHKYLQQDETQVDKMLCSQVWWEEQGWIMIPPDATIEGIDSLLKQIRKKLQQESTSDINVLNTKLVNLLKKYRIGEETARTIADRIADTYGAQRYMDGLCDELNKEDTKKERPEVDLEKEIKNERTILLDAFGPMNGEQSLTIRNFAYYFYELGLKARK